MKRVVINAILALLLMIAQANVDSAMGISAVCHFGVIAAVISGAFSMPLISSAIVMLVFALICDAFVSGPVGLFAFAFMLIFAVSRGILYKFRSERLIIIILWTCLLSIAFDALMSALYCAYYRDKIYFLIFMRIFWINALVTGIVTPMVMGIEQFLERLTTPRRSSGLL